MKHRFAALVLAVLLPALTLAAEVLPSPGLSVGVVKSPTAGKWVVFAEGFLPVQPQILEGGKVCIFEAPAGRYAVLFLPPGNEQPVVSIVLLGGVGPVPVPPPVVPPDPPTPDPTPVPVPIPSGPRTVLIIRESSSDTPAMNRLLVSLAAGKGHDYISSKGHAYFALDADDKLADGKPNPKVVGWLAAAHLDPPFVAILDTKGNILAVTQITKTTTDEDVLNLLKHWAAK